jgi:sulfonate transport system substrate-binding protein
MSHRIPVTRRQLLATAAGAAALAAQPAAWAQPAAKATSRVLRVGHQKGWLSILKARGTL